MKPFVDANKVAEVASAVKADPKLGQFTVTMTSQSNGGVGVKTRTETSVQGGVVDNSRVGKFITMAMNRLPY